MLPQLQLRDALRQTIHIVHAHRTGSREVALFGKVGAFLVGNAVYEFGDDEVQIGVALAMRVRSHVDRHAGHRGGEIRPMVEVEAAQEVLVGFAVTAVLRDDQAGHSLQQFSRPQQGAILQLGARHVALVGGFSGRRGGGCRTVGGDCPKLELGLLQAARMRDARMAPRPAQAPQCPHRPRVTRLHTTAPFAPDVVCEVLCKPHTTCRWVMALGEK